MEIWKNIIGFQGFYQVSNLGRIRSVRFNKIKLLITAINHFGYCYNCISIKNIKKNYTVHRLVALTFIPNTENKAQVNHINGIKTDNRVENLEWVTSKENINHAWKNGLSKSHKGEMSSKSKITENQALIIINAKRNSNNKRYWGLKELCEKIGISYGIGCEISKGNNWKHLF